MLHHDLLHPRPHQHLFFYRTVLLQAPVVPGTAHHRHLAHPFHTQAALHRHHFSDLVVDAFAPVLPLPWRRASILCKAPCKKSTSSTLSASARFSRCTCFVSAASRCRRGSFSLGCNRSRQR